MHLRSLFGSGSPSYEALLVMLRSRSRCRYLSGGVSKLRFKGSVTLVSGDPLNSRVWIL